MAKPSNLPEWDSTGINAIEPDTDHKQQGWLAPAGIPEKPPFQTFNYWMNEVWRWLKYVNETGLVEWDVSTEYDITDIQRGSDGMLYRSLTAANLGNDPVGDPINWENIQQALYVLFDDALVPFTAANVQEAIVEASERGGATGGGTNQVFFENETTVTEDYTITVGKNAVSAGPIDIADTKVVTVPDGSVWTVV